MENRIKPKGVNLNILFILFFFTGILFFSSCQPPKNDQDAQKVQHTIASAPTAEEVAAAQIAWGESLVNIGKTYTDKGDYRGEATKHIEKFYAYNQGSVLFKPTLACVKQFRTDFHGALSYFVGGEEDLKEDHGFALKPWSNVRWENVETKIIGEVALAMGNYYFTPAAGGEDVKVEYSFAYIKDSEGELKIVLHDSHLPFKPDEGHTSH